MKELRKLHGKMFTPVEKDYWDDGRNITRLYAPMTSAVEYINGQALMPMYLASWKEGADPKVEDCVSVERDEYRKYNVSYYEHFPNPEKTYEFLGKTWRLRENGWNYRYVKGDSYCEGCDRLESEGYVPSKAEWNMLCELSKIQQDTRRFFYKFQETYKVSDVGMDLSSSARVAYSVIKKEEPRYWTRLDKLTKHFNIDGTYEEVACVLAELWRHYDDIKVFQTAFIKEGLGPEPLGEFMMWLARMVSPKEEMETN